jgi:hypothetical protein
MRGTDPTKSKWVCPIMFYVRFRHDFFKKVLGVLVGFLFSISIL